MKVVFLEDFGNKKAGEVIVLHPFYLRNLLENGIVKAVNNAVEEEVEQPKKRNRKAK